MLTCERMEEVEWEVHVRLLWFCRHTIFFPSVLWSFHAIFFYHLGDALDPKHFLSRRDPPESFGSIPSFTLPTATIACLCRYEPNDLRSEGNCGAWWRRSLVLRDEVASPRYWCNPKGFRGLNAPGLTFAWFLCDSMCFRENSRDSRVSFEKFELFWISEAIRMGVDL